MRIAFGSDHAGFDLRHALAAGFAADGHDVSELGATSDAAYDYPDAADLVCEAVLSGSADLGVLVCGTGIGVSIRANRHSGIRAANCCNPEMATLARQHNHANILCLGARLLNLGQAAEITRVFLQTEEDASERHARRVRKLDGNFPAS